MKEYTTDVVADLQIEIPSDYLKLFCLIIDNKNIDGKREIPLHDWERYYSNGSVEPYFYIWEFSGTKYMKFLAGSGLDGKTYKIFYFKKATTALDGDADESIIPDEYREASAYWAAHRLLKSIGMNTRAAECRAEYDRLVAEAIIQFETEYIKKTGPEPDIGPDAPSTTDKQGGPGW